MTSKYINGFKLHLDNILSNYSLKEWLHKDFYNNHSIESTGKRILELIK